MMARKKKTETEEIKKPEAEKVQKKYHVVNHYLQTLGEVARLYGTTPEKIIKDNKLKNARIYQGQTLVIK